MTDANTKPCDIGARCRVCGHYETNYAKAEERYAHCPSCGRAPHWLPVKEQSRRVPTTEGNCAWLVRYSVTGYGGPFELGPWEYVQAQIMAEEIRSFDGVHDVDVVEARREDEP